MIINSDCISAMKEMEANTIDAIVTDPPYGLSFMGKGWDHGVPGVEFWSEALRVAKPGAHLLAFGGTRTYHRLACAIEDAGWEIRDCVMWVYGSGFPKSHDVSKAIDKAAGAEREVVGVRKDFAARAPKNNFNQFSAINPSDKGINSQAFAAKMGQITAPATPEAQQWAGWGTALKPALEPITVARKPFPGTVAANVLEYGTGAINVDGCRVGTEKVVTTNGKGFNGSFLGGENNNGGAIHEGRWPANLIHDGSDEVVGLFPNSGNGSGLPKIAKRARNKGWANSSPGDGVEAIDSYGDSGSAARFFYCAKASKADRDEGCEGFDEREAHKMSGGVCIAEGRTAAKGKAVSRNHHPTVKPTALMRYLCRLVTPPGGVVLDPFMGSGSTGKAAILEGFNFIGIEREAEYAEIARARIEHVKMQKQQELALC